MINANTSSMEQAADSIADRIHYLRTKIARLTRTDFALQIGSKPVNIAILEKGIRKPSIQLLNKFQQVYNVNTNWILTGSGEMLVSKSL